MEIIKMENNFILIINIRLKHLVELFMIIYKVYGFIIKKIVVIM